MFLPKSDYRARLEKPELMKSYWLRCGLGDPTFNANPAAVSALMKTTQETGANWYASEVPETTYVAAQEFLLSTFRVKLENLDQIKFTTLGTRCWPGYITLIYSLEKGRPMKWLAEKPGYPGHSIVINQYGGVCNRVGRKGMSYIDILEEMEKDGSLELYDAFIVQAVVNPTAEITSAETIKRCVALSQRTEKLLLFDGAYQCVIDGEPVPSPLEGIEIAGSNIVCLYSTSKGDQCAFLGYSFGFGDSYWTKMFDKVHRATREGGSYATYAALEACLKNPAFLKQTSAGYKRLGLNFKQALGEAGLVIPDWRGSVFSYFEIPENWIRAKKDSFDFALSLSELGGLVYPDYMFFGDGTCVRARLAKELEDESVRARLTETIVRLVKMY